MPIYTSLYRPAFVPDPYKRTSLGHKPTPFFDRRRSSPLIPDEQARTSKLQFASDSKVLQSKSKLFSFVHRNQTSSNRNSGKSPTATRKSVDKERKSACKLFNFLNLVKKEKSKPNNNQASRRQSDHRVLESNITSPLKRLSLSYRRSSKYKDTKLQPKSKEEPINDLAMFCQLLLIRTVTPKSKENLLLDQFDMKIDENYFIYYPYVFKYLIEKERNVKFNPDYLVANGFSVGFRSTLIDWLIKIQQFSKIQTESLQVAVTLIDMFTSLCFIRRSFYQLVGVAGLLIACKVVQRFHPKIRDLCYLTEDCYIPSHVKQMEVVMLERINFFVNLPIPMHFCHRGLLACIEIIDTDEIEVFCTYMFDMILLHHKSPAMRSSCKAAAAIFLARSIFYPEYAPWTKILQHYTMYGMEQLKDCLMVYMEMLDNIYKSNDYQFKSVMMKYSSPVYKYIAKNETLVNFATNPESQDKIKKLFYKI